MSCTPLQKRSKPTWTRQLSQLPCLVVNANFQVNNRHLLAVTSSDVLPGLISAKHCLHLCRLRQKLVNLFGYSIGGSTGELHPFS